MLANESKALQQIDADQLRLWNKPKPAGSAWQGRRCQVLGRRTKAGRLYSGFTATERVGGIRAIEIRGFEEVLRARDGSTQRRLRCRQIRLKKSQDGALEPWCAAALSILAVGG